MPDIELLPVEERAVKLQLLLDREAWEQLDASAFDRTKTYDVDFCYTGTDNDEIVSLAIYLRDDSPGFTQKWVKGMCIIGFDFKCKFDGWVSSTSVS